MSIGNVFYALRGSDMEVWALSVKLLPSPCAIEMTCEKFLYSSSLSRDNQNTMWLKTPEADFPLPWGRGWMSGPIFVTIKSCVSRSPAAGCFSRLCALGRERFKGDGQSQCKRIKIMTNETKRHISFVWNFEKHLFRGERGLAGKVSRLKNNNNQNQWIRRSQ